MPGMAHGKMDMTGAPGTGNGPMAGMDYSQMNHGGMATTPAPKGIFRRNLGPVEAALLGFSNALEVGKRNLAIARLAPQLVVAENGSVDDYAVYVGGYLASASAFAKTMKTVLLSRQVRADLVDLAFVISTSRVISNRNDQKVYLDVAETATLEKSGNDWNISRLE